MSRPVLCQSADGWSLHAPGSTDEAIASGDAPYLVRGPGEPTAADYAAARALLDPSLAEKHDFRAREALEYLSDMYRAQGKL